MFGDIVYLGETPCFRMEDFKAKINNEGGEFLEGLTQRRLSMYSIDDKYIFEL